MKRILLLLFIFCSLNIEAQSIYFPKENFRDKQTLSLKIPSLAKWVANNEEKTNPIEFYNNQIKQRIIAGEYNKALIYLDSMRILFGNQMNDSLLVKGIAIHAEIFAKAKISQQNNSNIYLDSLVKLQFKSIFSKLSDSAKNYVYSSLNSINRIIAEKLLDTAILKLNFKDSLTIKEAADVVGAYYSYTMAGPREIMDREFLKEQSKVYIITFEMVKMRDGSTVQVRTVRKRNISEKVPAIFSFNIYADEQIDLLYEKFNADLGYIGVVANTRGKGESPQELEPYEHDASDAYDIIDWISKQSWSDGRVGMEGGSYLGFTQWAAAGLLHPALKTIVPMVAVGPGIDFPQIGNIFMSYMLRWIDLVADNKMTLREERFLDDDYWDSIFRKWYAEGRSFRSLDTLSGRPSKLFQRWLDHPSLDEYWQKMIPSKTDFSKINIPILTITGYFDDDQQGAMYYYKQHLLYNPLAEHYLVIGPFDHGSAQTFSGKEVMGYELDSLASIFNAMKLRNEWYNYIFRSGQKPFFLKDKVNFEVMGGNEWKHVSSLKEMATDTLIFYLSSQKSASHYLLNTKAGKSFIQQSVDLADRSDSSKLIALISGVSHAQIIDTAINTANAVTFISEPITESLTISGSFLASLQTQINKKDMDIGIALFELMPDGKYFNLGVPFTRNIQRASYANDRSHRELLQPGKKTSIPIYKTFITCKKLETGSRLVMVLGINKNLDWQINYGSGKDVSDETIADAKIPLKIKWFEDSYLKIPVIKD